MTAPMTPNDVPTQPDEMIVEVIEVLDPSQASAHAPQAEGEPVEIVEIYVVEPESGAADPTSTTDPTGTVTPTADPDPAGTSHDPTGTAPTGTVDPTGVSHDPTSAPTADPGTHPDPASGVHDVSHDTPPADHADTHDASSDDDSF